MNVVSYRCKVLSFWVAFISAILMTAGACGGENVVLDYQGKIASAGRQFNGTGAFLFQLVDKSGKVKWQSGTISTNASGQTESERIAVREGQYSVRIGDPALGHRPLAREIIRGSDLPQLRVCFNDGTNGWHVAGPDSPLTDARGASLIEVNEEISSLRRELSLLRSQVERLSRVRSETNRFRTAEDPRSVSLPWRNAPALGESSAPIVLMEFADFECPACRRTHEMLFQSLVTNYVDVGQLLFVSRQMPLPQHKLAPVAARAAYCAGREGLYFEMYDRLYSDRAALESSGMMKVAGDLGLDISKFERCLSDPEFDSLLQLEAADARAAGVTATPSFILGRRSGDKLTGVLIVGGRPFQFFQEEIARMLKSPP